MRGGGTGVHEKLGCIEIDDHVFVGSGTIILGNVRIGQCVIVAAGSVVNKDVPAHSVVAGVPARVVGSFDDFMKKRMAEKPLPNGMRVNNQTVPDELAAYLWEQFKEQREERQ